MVAMPSCRLRSRFLPKWNTKSRSWAIVSEIVSRDRESEPTKPASRISWSCWMVMIDSAGMTIILVIKFRFCWRVVVRSLRTSLKLA